MIDLLPQIQEWVDHEEEIAVATVIRVVGSAPRPVGARMIVSTAGRMAGSVSGGCVETAVYEEMMDVLSGSPPRLLEFGITEDMIWDVGLACGGTIHVLVQELDPGLVAALAARIQRKEPVGLATVVSEMSGVGQPGIGESILVGEDGSPAWPDSPDTLDTSRFTPRISRLTNHVVQMLAARSQRGAVLEVAPGLQVYIEPFLPPPVLVVVGGVHVAIPLTRFAKELGFAVIVVDPRAKFANRARFPEADELLVEWPDEAFGHLDINRSTYVVLLTHDPKIDEPTLAAALRTEAAYIGAIGSRGTHGARFERMQKWGITSEDLRRVYAPIGLDLGGRTPEETALSIIAEVVAAKNGRSGASLRGTTGPIGSG
jgi:xanthine dehydrogenase accessory factor